MNSNRMRGKLAAAVIAGSVSVSAFALPARAEVRVEFDGYVAEYMDRVARIEQTHEESFRKFRTEDAVLRVRQEDALDKARFAGTEWGNERIFPDLASFSVPGLIGGMMERGIKAADPDFDGSVLVTIDEMKVKSFAFAVMKAPKSYMAGTVRVMDAGGNLVAEHEIWASNYPTYSQRHKYHGPDYAYRDGAQYTRVGPLVAEFTEKALETLYPGYDAPGAVILSR